MEGRILDDQPLWSYLAQAANLMWQSSAVLDMGTEGKDEFVLVLNCVGEKKYLEWREIYPPPPGAKDWYEILLTKDEHFQP